MSRAGYWYRRRVDLVALHPAPMCTNCLPVQVYIVDVSFNSTYLVSIKRKCAD